MTMASPATTRSKSTITILFPLSLLLLSFLQVGHFVAKHVDINAFVSSAVTKNLHEKSLHQCNHEYSIQLLSLDPLVLYVNNFIKDEEIRHLLDRT